MESKVTHSRLADAHKLQQEMRNHFDSEFQRAVVARVEEAFGCLASSGSVSRPKWYFDLNAIIHPALTIDLDLNITGCSNALCNFVSHAFPDLRNRVDNSSIGIQEFLERLDLFHFDYDSLSPSQQHVLDPDGKNLGLLEHLAVNKCVDKKPAMMRVGATEHYIELSFALQIAFPGAQSIWHIVDQRVGQMRLIRAMRLTKWFITAHRLKQSTNLFNVARATLELLSDNHKNERLTTKDIQTELTDIDSTLSSGIEEFSRFINEISRDEYKIATLQLDQSDKVDVLALLEDVVTDIDIIYAKPAKVRITLENCAFEGFTIRATPFLLREALFNIVHNAFKHGARVSKSEPEIKIRCTCSITTLSIDVEDSGPGMSPNDVAELAHMFKEIRTDVSPSEVGALSGLSLAMSVIKSSGGSMSFENLPSGFRQSLQFAGDAADVRTSQ
jgi:signal transduction histidine kinase